MNQAYNHGSQGDFFASSALEVPAEVKTISKAPIGVGEEIRAAARNQVHRT
jgi:hypothetical protein